MHLILLQVITFSLFMLFWYIYRRFDINGWMHQKLRVVRDSLIRAFRIAVCIWVGYVLIHTALHDFLSHDPEMVDSPYLNYAVHVFLYVLAFLESKVMLIYSFAGHLFVFIIKVIRSVGLSMAPLIVFFILRYIFSRKETNKTLAHQVNVKRTSRILTAWHTLGRICSGKGKLSASTTMKIDSNLVFFKVKRINMSHEEIASQTEKASLEIVTGINATEPTLEYTDSASVGFSSLPKRLFSKVRKIDVNHEKIATQAENVSMTTGVVAGIAAAGAAIAAPTGLSAIGVALGITSLPLIVTAAPILGAVATVAGTISGGTYFYSKWKNNRKKANKSEEQSHD